MTVTDGAPALTSTAFTNHNKCSLLGGLRVQSCELCLLIDTSGSASPSASLPLHSPKACWSRRRQAEPAASVKRSFLKNLFIYSLTFTALLFFCSFSALNNTCLVSARTPQSPLWIFPPKSKWKQNFHPFLSVLPAPLAHFQSGEWKGKCAFKGTSSLCS